MLNTSSVRTNFLLIPRVWSTCDHYYTTITSVLTFVTFYNLTLGFLCKTSEKRVDYSEEHM